MLRDDKRIFESGWPPSRATIIFVVALISQVAVWLAGPTPVDIDWAQGVENENQNFLTALRIAVITFLCFFVIPVVAALICRISLAELGLSIGNWKLGLFVVVIGVPVVGIGLFIGCDDSQIMAAYPWAGKWLAQSLSNMVLWFLIYGLYYIGFEFFYRGFVMRGLEPELGLIAAIWIQAIMSVMIHFGKPTSELLASVPAAFFFAWLAIKSRSVIYVILIHWAIGIFNDLFAMYHKEWLLLNDF